MAQNAAQRVAWVDYAKGFCIIMVVMMHSTLGVEKAAGAASWMNAVIEFARPFRMPDFFMIAGLFLALTIGRGWRTYLDRKVVHFAYFYALWVTIQFALRAPGLIGEVGPLGLVREYLFAYVEPFGTLWFIYLLPVFFVTTRLLYRVPMPLVLGCAAALQILDLHTGWLVIDEFAERYVYFYMGYVFAPHIFRFARGVGDDKLYGLVGLAAWALINGTLVYTGWADFPGIGLALGVMGAAAVIAFAAILSRLDVMGFVRYCGMNSIVVYLAFSPFMAASRVVLLKTGLVPDLGMVALLVTMAGVIGPLLLHWAVRNTPGRYLFERPGVARLGEAPRRPRLQPAE